MPIVISITIEELGDSEILFNVESKKQGEHVTELEAQLASDFHFDLLNDLRKRQEEEQQNNG